MAHWLSKLFFSRGKAGDEIHPEDIFLDNHNLPQFDRYQMEGRIERPITNTAILGVGIIFLAVGLLFSGRLFTLQVVEGDVFTKRSENNRLRHSLLISERGVVHDADGNKLAWNHMPNDTAAFAKRQYATTSGMAHVIGYLTYPQKDTSGVYYQESYEGKRGVEKTFNDVLAGQNGVKIIEIDANNVIRSQNTIRKPHDGQSITLTIDSALQEKLFSLMRRRVEESGFQGAAGIIMDVKTGELVALTSYPEYDPQVMTGGEEEKIRDESGKANNPFLNRAVGGLFVPGSIVKPYLALGALEEGIINPRDNVLSTGSLSIPNPYNPDNPTIFYDWKAHGYVDMREALAVSSNVYFYYVGGGYKDQEGLGIEKIKDYLQMFGFGQKTHIRLDGEKRGLIPDPAWKEQVFDGDPWRIGDTYNTAIGQFGVQVTPIQATRAVAAIANEGYLLEPKIRQSSSSQLTGKPDIAIAKEHYTVIKEGMRQGVTSGTAAGLNVSYLEVAAKTGTAEIGSKVVNSWATGFYPYKEPRYAFTVVMERGPRENTLGGIWVMRNFFDWVQQTRPEHFE